MLKYVVLVWMAAVILAVFLTPLNVEGLGETTYNIFFHVSMAITATVAFAACAWFGIQYLRKKDIAVDAKIEATAGLGFLFSVLSTVTGAIWAKFTWGTFWNWDPRQTSSFILLLIYAALLTLRHSVEDDEKAARLSSVYAVFAFLPMMFLMFVLPRLLPGLHPGSDTDDVNPAISQSTDIEIRVLLYTAWVGFILLFIWMYKIKTRQLLIEKKYD